MQQIVNGMNAFGCEHICQARSNALYVLNGSRRFEHLKRMLAGDSRRHPVLAVRTQCVKLPRLGNCRVKVWTQFRLHCSPPFCAGNAVYFLLMPHLPAARHVPFQTDLGLLVDACFCLVFLGVIKVVAGRKSLPK